MEWGIGRFGEDFFSRKKAQEERKKLRLGVEVLGQRVFFNLKDRGTEIDEEEIF
jgi:hypothetical protein